MTAAGDVGDVAFEPGQRAGAGERGLVEHGPVLGVLDEPGRAGGFAAGDDVAGAVLLQRSGSCCPATARLAEYAHTARHDFGCAWGSQTGSASRAGSLSLLRPVLRGEGVDDLPVAEYVSVPAEV